MVPLSTPVPPLAPGKIPVTPVVKGKPVALVKVPEAGVPKTGAVMIGLVKVLLVNVSVPAKVAKVPVVGRVTVVAAVAVNVVAKAPEVVKFPPKVIVLVPLSTPVPPLAPGKIPVTAVAIGKPVALVKSIAEGVPKSGVTKVGLVAKTKAPVPVSSVTAVNRFALDGVANAVATPVPNPLTPVAIGNPVALVKVPDAGVPKTGAVMVGLVNVLLVKVSVPSNVANVPEAAGKVIAVVPATAGAAIVAVPEVAPVNSTEVAVAAPKSGVTKVGEVALTTSPDPVVANSCTDPVLPEKFPNTLLSDTF